MEYPIGIQTFSEIRKYNCRYVDKTALAWELAHTGKYIFLSRPRRFGKSLLLSTLEEYFRGNKQLFEGLKISELESEWTQYPVLHFDFNTVGSRNITDLTDSLHRQLSTYESRYGLTPDNDIAKQDRFINLIQKVHDVSHQNVVILIDEYDKPLLNTIENPQLQDDFRSILKPFYGVLKTMDQNIRFAMITGVARFGKESIFSDLNNIRDISLEPRFNAICGITQDELYSVFDDSIEQLAEEYGKDTLWMKQELKANYDGYHFGAPQKCSDIYNPFSIINAFAKRKIGDYWFESGSPSLLVKRLIRRGYDFPELSNVAATTDELLSGITADDSSIGQLFQTGYLTITNYDSENDLYELGFPNKEVEKGFDKLSLSVYGSMASRDFDIAQFRKEVVSGHPEKFMSRLQSFTADFPYDQIPDLEVHWQNMMYLLFKLLGFYTRTEYKTSDGRIDAVVTTPKYVYVFEFKMDQSPLKAIAQINSKNYTLPFESNGRKIFKIGVEFASTSRRITDWIIE